MMNSTRLLALLIAGLSTTVLAAEPVTNKAVAGGKNEQSADAWTFGFYLDQPSYPRQVLSLGRRFAVNDGRMGDSFGVNVEVGSSTASRVENGRVQEKDYGDAGVSLLAVKALSSWAHAGTPLSESFRSRTGLKLGGQSYDRSDGRLGKFAYMEMSFGIEQATYLTWSQTDQVSGRFGGIGMFADAVLRVNVVDSREPAFVGGRLVDPIQVIPRIGFQMDL